MFYEHMNCVSINALCIEIIIFNVKDFTTIKIMFIHIPIIFHEQIRIGMVLCYYVIDLLQWLPVMIVPSHFNINTEPIEKT